MKTITKQNITEIFFSMMLALGVVLIANAQDNQSPQKRVRVEIEVTEDGKTSTSTQEIQLDQNTINGELDEMVEEIEMILEEAVRDIEETDLEIVIRRNQNGFPPHRYRHRMMAIPDAPSLWHMEGEPRAFLGVVANEVEEDELKELNIDHGSRIESVVEGSAAESAGLQEGDIITSIGGEKTPDFGSLAKAIRSHEPGESVDIELIRDGKNESITAELGEQQHKFKHFNKHFDDDFDFDFYFNGDKIVGCAPKDLDKQAFLGIEGKSVEDAGGVNVTKIFEGSSAEEAGLQEGDRIYELNDKEVTEIGELVEIIRAMQPGDDLKIEFERDGKKMKESVSLGSKEGVEIFEMRTPHPPRAPHPHMSKKFKFSFMDIKEMDDNEIEEFSSKTGEDFATDNSLAVENLMITPNPNDGQFRVRFELPEKGDMELRVFDSTGRKIVEESIKDFEGMFSNEYDLNETDSGIYILSISQNGKGRFSKIVKQ